MKPHFRACLALVLVSFLDLSFLQVKTFAAPVPVLETIFPIGGRAGEQVIVTVSGSHLTGLKTLECSARGVRCELVESNRFQLSIPPNTPPGFYDIWAVSDVGVSSPRTFHVGLRQEGVEVESDDPKMAPQKVPLNIVINGRIDKPSDSDRFQFEAKQNDRVIINCLAERIDSRLRPVLELFDPKGRRIAVNRGYYGTDPLIDFRVPYDGSFILEIQDLIGNGGLEHQYRLEIDTGPRVEFTIPNVVQRGTTSKVKLCGWNLDRGSKMNSDQSASFDVVDVEISADQAVDQWPLPARLSPAQAVVEGFSYLYPDSQTSVVIGLTDLPMTISPSFFQIGSRSIRSHRSQRSIEIR
ncbi:MAG: hypothetical protein FJ267_01955 [Planctomycetes bacterium]|nr:hypothetical protein [Planctomycetota bacterium]